ncbi:PD40 domain-containing protein [Parasphingorhabdus halotolerans]|uniref:WD40-like Beta Propeller Repeat n=1 Tax=Parasphingorhabdus halotolerans TaxID=2725558 RepID=A0A6H2DQG6_9SPHN|nr:PD40 domain-containing protein [Parasphingorhabdus halotolerans]QJB70377.1 hypothetical protein HF685_14790 [Parasphingorhabdus halotolerans]
MTHFTASVALLLAFLIVSSVSHAQDELPVREGPYLGQKPPGSNPEPFAPGIVSTQGWEYGAVFTPDMKEIYFLRENAETKKHELVTFKYDNSRWVQSNVSPRIGQPMIAPDGNTMHLGRRYKERIGNRWSDVKFLTPPFEDMLIMRLTASMNGTYYFDTFDKNNSSFPIRYSRMIDGKREEPKILSKEINTGTHILHPFIAPDESYLIWDAKREGGYGDSDIYISFRNQDGTWGKAINLGDKINTDAWEAAASVTPDGKYLFFNRNMGSDKYENVDIFWVDAQVIENLRPKNESSITAASPYLGQKLPGSTAEIFAPGIVNTAENREIEGMFAADMKAFYFVKRPLGEESASNVLAAIEYKNGKWEETVVKTGVGEPSVSPDGMILYFKNEYIERTSEGWSDIKSLGAPFKDIDIMRLSASSNGTYYFDTFTPELETPLRYSRLMDGKYEQPKSLGPQFAVGKYNAHPFVAPDESYVIWDSRREGGYGTSDLYISYRATDGSWGPAINLGDKINTAAAENYPSVSPDGKYLFFDRRTRSADNTEVDIYWVDAGFIETLRPRQ